MVSATLLKWGKIAGAGQEGIRRIAVSPTGSTHRWLPMRVTNDRVAASRARLGNGHEAPDQSRLLTCAGCPTVQQLHLGRNTPLDQRSRDVGGRARGAVVRKSMLR